MGNKIKDLFGETICKIEGADPGSDEILFFTESGKKFRMMHHQSCCESVTVDEIIGDIDDLIDSPVVEAEEVTSTEDPKEAADACYLWTFYKLRTAKGPVTIRWWGESNGYYGEEVDFEEIE